MERPPTAAREAGRGFLLITGAKLWFLVTATFTSLAFPRLFGDPAAFGEFRVVSGVVNVVAMVVIAATVQAVSKLASEAGADLAAVRRTAFTVQAKVFGPVFLAMLLGSGWIAGEALSDDRLGPPLAVASFIVLAYAFYAALVGILNGTRAFGRQAGLDATFSTLKTGLMVAAVVTLGTATAAFGAFALAAALILLTALFVVRLPPVGGTADPGLSRRMLRYLVPLAGYAFVLNVLLQADVIGLKALAHGDPAAASAAAGVYGAVRNAALIPYQAVISLAFVVFPFVSRAASEGDRDSARRAADGALRLAALLSGAAVATLGAVPVPLVTLLFGPGYAPGAPLLLPLLAAGGLAAMLHVGNAVLASLGRPWEPFAAGAVAAAVQVGAIVAWVPGSADPTTAAAQATVAGAAVGAVLTAAFLLRHVGPGPWVPATAATALAAAAGVWVGGDLADGLAWPLRAVVAAAVFGGGAVLLRAVKASDLARFRRR